MTPTYRLARGGPSPRARKDAALKYDEGRQAWLLHWGSRATFAEIGQQLGLSAATAWRRYWYFCDLDHAQRQGIPRDHVPPQRGTRECPRGGPAVLVRPADRDGLRRRLRHPLPALPCTARRSTDGGLCRRWATRGASVCRAHGAAAPQVRAAAARRVAQAEENERRLRTGPGKYRLAPYSDRRLVDLRVEVLDQGPAWRPPLVGRRR